MYLIYKHTNKQTLDLRPNILTFTRLNSFQFETFNSGFAKLKVWFYCPFVRKTQICQGWLQAIFMNRKSDSSVLRWQIAGTLQGLQLESIGRTNHGGFSYLDHRSDQMSPVTLAGQYVSHLWTIWMTRTGNYVGLVVYRYTFLSFYSCIICFQTNYRNL